MIICFFQSSIWKVYTIKLATEFCGWNDKKRLSKPLELEKDFVEKYKTINIPL